MGKINSNGSLLANFSVAYNLQCEEIHKVTPIHPRSKHGHTLDYVLVRQRDLGEVMQTRAKKGATCDTDHFLLVSRLLLSYHRPNKNTRNRRPLKINVAKLRDKTVAGDYKHALDASLAAQATHDLDWRRIQGSVLEVSACVGAHTATGLTGLTNPSW